MFAIEPDDQVLESMMPPQDEKWVFSARRKAPKETTFQVQCSAILIVGTDVAQPQIEMAKDVHGVVCKDIQVPGSEKEFVAGLEECFLCEDINEDFVERLRKYIVAYYVAKQHPFVDVIIPEQEITSGVVQVQIEESRIAKISVEGNRFDSASQLQKYLGVHEHDTIDLNQLTKGIDFINRNPFRRADLVLSPGAEPHTTNLDLVLKERRPYRVYSGADNSGIETIKRNRFLAGLNAAKVFNLDHFFTYQYTSSWNFHQFQAHTAQYLAFLPWQHVLNMFGGVSWVNNVELPAPSTRNNGASYQASGRYIVPLNPMRSFSHEWGLGFDFKRTNNTVAFAELNPTIGPNVNLSQFIGRYAGNWKITGHAIEFQTELFVSPGAMLGDESDVAYNALRPNAKNHWVYWRTMGNYTFQTPKLHLDLYLQWQWSSQNLLPSEQIGLGGFDSVRGYDERQLNYDSGLIFNAECGPAAFPVIGRWTKRSALQDSLQLLLFYDFGLGTNHNLIPGEKNFDYLIGAGPALRYLIDPWLSFRLDLGFKLHQESNFTGGNAMWYFSAVVNY